MVAQTQLFTLLGHGFPLLCDPNLRIRLPGTHWRALRRSFDKTISLVCASVQFILHVTSSSILWNPTTHFRSGVGCPASTVKRRLTGRTFCWPFATTNRVKKSSRVAILWIEWTHVDLTLQTPKARGQGILFLSSGEGWSKESGFRSHHQSSHLIRTVTHQKDGQLSLFSPTKSMDKSLTTASSTRYPLTTLPLSLSNHYSLQVT